MPTDTKRLWRKDLASEFETDLRTVDRWKQDGTLPKPKRWHGRPFWTREQLKRAEQIQARRWDAKERAHNERADKLRKAKLLAKVESGQLNSNQLALPLI